MLSIIACIAMALTSYNIDDNTTVQSGASETMFQVATLQSLMIGNYDGYISVGELRQWGDIGVGTFDKIDGEMIVLDGTVYQARYDGTVNTADDNIMVPFATVTHFDNDFSLRINGIKSMAHLSEIVDAEVRRRGINSIYVMRMDVSHCDKVLVRSELPQTKPYKHLAEVMKTDQREFTYNNVNGTIVAVYFPSFFNQQNTSGWHFHFITNDRKHGGHLLDISTPTPSTAFLDATNNFHLYMPRDDSFNTKDLGKDMRDDIKGVEK